MNYIKFQEIIGDSIKTITSYSSVIADIVCATSGLIRGYIVHYIVG